MDSGAANFVIKFAVELESVEEIDDFVENSRKLNAADKDVILCAKKSIIRAIEEKKTRRKT